MPDLWISFWGAKYYGKTEHVPGVFFIATRFYHYQLIPLIPVGSYLILDDGTRDDSDWKVVSIPLSAKSVLLAYARAFLWPAAVVTCLNSICGCACWMLTGRALHDDIAIVTVFAVFFATGLWLSYRFTEARKERALYLADTCGLEPKTVEAIRAYVKEGDEISWMSIDDFAPLGQKKT